jgi:hypothetical protein
MDVQGKQSLLRLIARIMHTTGAKIDIRFERLVISTSKQIKDFLNDW